jgi:shikimate dehydrogenase
VSVRLAVLGDPLAYTRSPELHRAGLVALGLPGESRALRTPAAELGRRLHELADDGYRGVNLTTPLKEAALAHLARIAPRARTARSVNTIGFDAGGWWGDSTDGAGFVAFLARVGRPADGARAVMFGAGAAARSVAQALVEAGATLAVWARDPARARAAWAGLPEPAWHAWGGSDARAALARATLVVQATPLDDAAALPPPDEAPSGALLVDLRYGPEPTAWVRAARAAGRAAHDGLGLLVCQARESLALWTGRDVPLEPLAAAVGWTP